MPLQLCITASDAPTAVSVEAYAGPLWRAPQSLQEAKRPRSQERARGRPATLKWAVPWQAPACSRNLDAGRFSLLLRPGSSPPRHVVHGGLRQRLQSASFGKRWAAPEF